jgi:hypothetical protein
MKLSLHISPTRTSFSTTQGTISARIAERCELIAELIRVAGADVEVAETPLGTVNSDFSLVFAADLAWHVSTGNQTDRVVVLNADRDQILEIAEGGHIAAALFYIGVDTLRRVTNGLVVRREIAAGLGGTLGPGAPYFMSSENYASWTSPQYSSMADLLVAYLNAWTPVLPVLVSASDAISRGLPGLTIRVDARHAGMHARLFPATSIYAVLNGPPGAPIAISIWDCSDAPSNIETAIRAKFVPPWGRDLEIVSAGRASLLGGDQAGMTFTTGSGIGRMAWFGVLAKHSSGTALVAFGAPGSDGRIFTAQDVLSNPLIAKAVATLKIESCA